MNEIFELFISLVFACVQRPRIRRYRSDVRFARAHIASFIAHPYARRGMNYYRIQINRAVYPMQ